MVCKHCVAGAVVFLKGLRKGNCHVSTRPPGNLRMDSSYTIRVRTRTIRFRPETMGHHQLLSQLIDCTATRTCPHSGANGSTSSWRRPAIFLFAVASRERSTRVSATHKAIASKKRRERTGRTPRSELDEVHTLPQWNNRQRPGLHALCITTTTQGLILWLYLNLPSLPT